MIKFDLLIFDLDGTLIDSSVDLSNAVNMTLRAFGLAYLSKARIMSYVGFGSRELIKRSLGSRRHLINEAHNFYLKYYLKHMCDNTRVYPDVTTTLRNLKKFKKCRMVVFSNRSGVAMRKLLGTFGIRKFFADTIGDDDGFARKPNTGAIRHWIEKFEIPKERILMVGDSKVDVDTGRKVGIKTCLVKYGFARYQGGSSGISPDYKVNTFAQILSIV